MSDQGNTADSTWYQPGHETVLPSWKDRRHAMLTEPEIKEIVESWRSGRLVDREAIDYEAALDRLMDWANEVEGMTTGLDAVQAIVAAAIGDTDE